MNIIFFNVCISRIIFNSDLLSAIKPADNHSMLRRKFIDESVSLMNATNFKSAREDKVWGIHKIICIRPRKIFYSLYLNVKKITA